MTRSNLVATAVFAAALVVTGSASAQSKTWNLSLSSPSACASSGSGSTVGSGTTSANNIGNSYGCAGSSGQSMEVTAWSGSAASNYAKAALTNQGDNGFGVGNVAERGTLVGSSPDHSVDSGTNGTDALMLKFLSGPEALTHVTVGWSGSDGDFSVLRWKGASAPTLAQMNAVNTGSLVGMGGAGMGWDLVAVVNGNANVNTPNMTVSFNDTKATSSYWLLSAYNSDFTADDGTFNAITMNGSSGGATVNAGSTVDALKFLGVGTTNAVPEPTSLALVGVALLGGLATRRKGRVAA